MLPERIENDRVALYWDDAEALVRDTDLGVGLKPGSGLGLSDDWWVGRVDSLAVDHTGYGVDDTLIGLTHKVRGVVRERLADGDYDQRSLPVLLRLWMADQTQRLGALLQQEARLYEWSYDEMCEPEHV